jgi:hypothetical protein
MDTTGTVAALHLRMKTSLVTLLLVTLGACVSGCTLFSPVDSTYVAGKSALSDGDGGADGGTTNADGETLCCKQSSGMSAGTCIPSSTIPDGSASEVSQDTCTSGDSCVPTDQVNGTSTACGLLGGTVKGVCMGTCFSQYLADTKFLLESSECNADSVCVPCSALSGKMVAGCE